jgi:hypothetical protein
MSVSVSLSDASKASIFQIPNIGYNNNRHQLEKKKRIETMLTQECFWKGYNIELEVFNENHRYRKATFPKGWTYQVNKDDIFRRSGYYINPEGEKIVKVFMKDASYEMGCFINFTNLYALV